MSIFVLIPLICAAIYGVLAGIALRHPTRMRIVFAMYLLAGAAWSFSSAMAHLELPHEQTYFWGKMLVISGMSGMIFYYHFTRRFTSQHLTPLVYLGYSTLIVITVLTAFGYILKDAYFAEGSLYLDYGENTINMHLVAVVALPFAMGAIIHLARYYRTLTDPVARNRIIYLLIGIWTFIFFGFTDLIAPLLKYPIDYVGGILNGLLITYAILKYQLLDIKVILRKGLVYSALTMLITATYLLLIFALQTLFHEWIGYSLALAASLAIIIAIVFNPLRNFLQERIDRLFYRQTYDYRQMLLNFSNKVSNVLDLGELAQSILDPIITAMHAKQAALLFPEIGSGDFNTRFAQQFNNNDDDPHPRLKLTNNNPVVTWLAAEGKVLPRRLIDILPQFKGLWEVERTALNALGIELFCPIRSRGKLIGILTLGRKQSDSPYTEEETALLMTMANEAGIVVENASMLDSLKAQQLQVEQLLAQVVLAQEEERNRISIDLHDSVAQWLVGASYRLQTFDKILNGDEKARIELADMEHTVTKSLKELRRVVVGLRPPALDELGLTHALRRSLEELKTEGLDCEFRLVGEPFRLPSSMEIAVYRVTQETLSNIRKHAQASKVNLRLQFQKDKLLVEVRDNGQGFDLQQTLENAISVGRMGLLGMKQRAEMLGGNMTIKTREGVGTTVTFILPIQQQGKES